MGDEIKDEVVDRDNIKFIQATIEQVGDEKLFVASDSTVDREGEILDVDGWVLEDFKRNPVILWGHNAQEPPIGTAEKIGYRTVNGSKKLVFEPKFHNVTQRAREIGEMVKAGLINTVSVGFLPLKMVENKFVKQHLLEISFVSVPANPNATQLALSKGFDPLLVKEIFSGVKDTEGKAPKEGDKCSMDDGSEGMMTVMDDGTMQCMKSKEKEISILDIIGMPEHLKEFQSLQKRVDQFAFTGMKATDRSRVQKGKDPQHRTLVAIQKIAEAMTTDVNKKSLKHKQINQICRLTEMLISERKNK